MSTPVMPSGSPVQDGFHIFRKIGTGSFGHVYQAIQRSSDATVALKCLNYRTEQEQSMFEREISIMSFLKKEMPDHAVGLVEAIRIAEKKEIILVMEYMEHDLWGLMVEPTVVFSLAQIKHYMEQLFTALFKLHCRGYMHRDIKGANLLVDQKGNLKLADFGACTKYKDRETFSYTNVTLPYRAPELLLRCSKYGPEVDMWAAGCVFIELITKKPFLHGQNEVQQFFKLVDMFGTPNETVWPGVSSLPGYSDMLPPNYPIRENKLRVLLQKFPPQVQDLAAQLLQWDPSKRLTAEQALEHDFFFSEPLAESYVPVSYQNHNHGFTVVNAHTKAAQNRARQPPEESNSNPLKRNSETDSHNAKRQCRH